MARKGARVNLYRTSFGNVQTLSPETLNSFAWEPDGLRCYDFQKRTLEIVEGVSPTDLLTRGFFRDRIIPPLNWRTPEVACSDVLEFAAGVGKTDLFSRNDLR